MSRLGCTGGRGLLKQGSSPIFGAQTVSGARMREPTHLLFPRSRSTLVGAAAALALCLVAPLSGCSPVCPEGQVTCGDQCADLTSDPSACGSCDIKCPEGGQCNSGQCECGPGLTTCGNACVDLANDPDNCGECGHACGLGT